MAVIFGSLGAFVLIVAIAVVCCVSHFVVLNAWTVKNTTIRRRKSVILKKLDKESCGVYIKSIIG